MFWKKSAIRCLFYLLFALSAAQLLPSQTISNPQVQRPELNTIVQRMEQAARENRERYRAYVITREYRIYGGAAQKPSSTVMADISFVPPRSKEFTITQSQGSSRGETVVRHILENEQKAAETGQAPGAVSRENYNFTLEGEQAVNGHDCFVLGLLPKRKEKSLVAGRAWVDKSTYLVRRVQGQLAKMPSWWIKSADVTLEFGDLGGMWLQTQTTAKADVRLAGPHTLQENALRVRTAKSVAEVINQRAPAARRGLRHPQAALGSFER